MTGPVPRAVGRRTLLGLAGAGAAGALAGCVRVPTSGEVKEVVPSGRASPPRVDIKVDPPAPGASPRKIVASFLLAMASYQPNYETARLFLTADVRDDWRPEAGVEILDDNYVPTSTEAGATVRGKLVGRLGPNGSYRAASGPVAIDLGLVRDKDGEWRISKPPNGLLIAQYEFDRAYRAVNLYFFEPGLGSLVPDPIYLPQGNLTPSTLMQRLIAGPSDWLRPGVTTAFPDKASALAVPVDTAGVVEIALNDVAAGLNNQRRTLLAAQTVWTLRQVSGVTGVRFSLNGAPYQIGQGDPDAAVSVTAMDRYSPVSPQISTQLFAATAAGLVRIDDSGGRRDGAAVAGPLGQLGGIREVAASVAGDRAAVVVREGREVRVGEIGEREPVTVLTGLSGLRQPQYTRFGELLVLQRSPGTSVLWQVRDSVAQRVAVDLPAGAALTALRIAPDGMRVAVVVTDEQGAVHFGLMLLARNGGPRLASFRAIPLTLAQGTTLARVTDVVWTAATSLALLGSDTVDGTPRPYSVTQDGTQLLTMGAPADWPGGTLAASQGRQAGTESVSTKIAMLATTGALWRFEGNFSWSAMGQDLTAIGYPG